MNGLLLNWIQKSKGILPPSFPLPPSGLCPCTGKIKIAITIINTLNPNNIHCSLYISSGTNNESLFDNQELPKLMIIAFIFVTFTI